MAKIEWTFKNEEGTNLNRYIATNVLTGEKITFDLLRGGNISVVGTPLNAENLNALITSINACYDLISSSEKDTTYTLSKNGNAIRLTDSNGKINDVTLNKSDVGLGNVDNTSDKDKPISNATQNALNDKVPITRKINGYSLNENINLSASDVGARPSSWTPDKNEVGLGKVDNTSDMDKPISNATQNALNTKADKTEIQQALEEVKKEFEKTIAEVNCSHEVEITGFGEEDCNLAIDDQDVVITKIQGQTRRKSLNLLKVPDVAETTKNGITYSIKNGVITLNGTATASFAISYTALLESNVITFLNKTLMTYTTGSYSGEIYTNVYRTDYSSIKYILVSEGINTFNDNSYLYTINVEIRSGVVCNNFKLSYMLVEDTYTTIIPYEPYDNTLVNSKCDFVSTGRNLINSDLKSVFAYNTYVLGSVSLPKGKYTIRITSSENAGAHTLNIIDEYGNSSNITGGLPLNNQLTFTLDKDYPNAKLSAFFDNTNTDINIYLMYDDISKLEPYVEDTMKCGLELGAFDYHDNVNNITHRQTSEMITLNGSESWQLSETNTSGKKRFYILANNAYGGTTSMNVASNWIDGTADDTYLCKNCISCDGYGIIIYVDGITTVDSFKQWLQANPITFVYKLATETTETNILPSGYKVWYKGMQVQKTETLPYILTKQYAISLASQVLNNASIDRSQQKQIDELKENKLNKSDLGHWNFDNRDLKVNNKRILSLSGDGTHLNTYDYDLYLEGASPRPFYYDGNSEEEIALIKDLDDIILRLDELGFKQGVVYYDGTAVDNTLATIKKQGKIAILNAIAPALGVSTISVPAEFKPKEETTIMCMASSTLGISIANTISIKTDGTITTPSNFVKIVNAAWEIA